MGMGKGKGEPKGYEFGRKTKEEFYLKLMALPKKSQKNP